MAVLAPLVLLGLFFCKKEILPKREEQQEQQFQVFLVRMALVLMVQEQLPSQLFPNLKRRSHLDLGLFTLPFPPRLRDHRIPHQCQQNRSHHRDLQSPPNHRPDQSQIHHLDHIRSHLSSRMDHQTELPLLTFQACQKEQGHRRQKDRWSKAVKARAVVLPTPLILFLYQLMMFHLGYSWNPYCSQRLENLQLQEVQQSLTCHHTYRVRTPHLFLDVSLRYNRCSLN